MLRRAGRDAACRACRGALLIALLAGVAADTAIAQSQPDAAVPFVELSANQRPPQALPTDVLRQRSAEVHIADLENRGLVSQQLGLDFFPDVSYTAVLSHATRTATGLTWIGQLESVSRSMAVFARVGRDVAGFVASPYGSFSLERDRAGGYTVQQFVFDRRRLTTDDIVGASRTQRGDTQFPTHAHGQAFTGDHTAFRRSLDAASGHDSNVDVLVALEKEVIAAQVGGIDALLAKTLVMIGVADAALRATGTGAVRLAGTAVASDESEFEEISFVDGDRYSADVITWIHPGFGSAAYLLTRDHTPFPLSNSVGAYVMLGTTFAHELGHNLGLVHDWYVEDLSGGYGWDPWGRGHVSQAGQFHTIMAYSEYCKYLFGYYQVCSELPFYSDPDREHWGVPVGIPIGTNTTCTAGEYAALPCDADAATTLAETVPIIAGLRHHDNRLRAGTSLGPGQFLRSQGVGAACALVYQSDGNLVARYADGFEYWSSGTAGTRPGSVVMQNDGNLIIYDSQGAAVWATRTHRNPGATLAIQRDCNVVVRAASGTALWASGAPGPAMPPLAPAIYEFSADPTTILSSGQSTITLDASGFEHSIWITHPNGEREDWSSGPLVSTIRGGYYHVPERGTGTTTIEATVTGADGTTPATATVEVIVTR